MKTTYILCLLFLFSVLGSWAQAPEFGQYRPATLVNNALNAGQPFTTTSLFEMNSQESDVANHPVLSRALDEGTLLSVKQNNIASLIQNPSQSISLQIPTHEGMQVLKLVKVDVVKPGVLVRTSSLGDLNLDMGLHYRGLVEGHTNSMVAISIFGDEVMGFFSSDEINGNYVIGKIKEENSTQHIVYNEADLKTPVAFGCFTEDDGEGYEAADLLPRPASEDVGDCVNVYVEVDFNYYQNYSSSTATTTNNITGMFNQAITVYAGENVNMEISDIFIWTSTSPYSGGASTMRTQFQNQTSSINGDLGHLVSYSTSGGSGIAAGFSGVCPSNVDQSLCVTQTNGAYATVPTYSRQVKVVTHEMGHLLGSRHSHACVWNGNNTAIDDYGNTNPPSGGSPVSGAEGGACFVSPGQITVTATIMSYYDSRGWGNFSMGNGFGTQPGNVVRNSIANGSCLSPCGGGGPDPCTSTVTSFPYSNDFESGLGWTQGSGDDFDWTRNSGGTPSSGTGPTAASQGTWYAYMEVSSPNYPSKTALLNSPCFNLNGVTNPEITFDYQMLFSPGTIRLEASTDGANWTQIWSLTGDQGAAWQGATVSLNAYTSATELRLRFNGTSGTTWQGDICIDDIGVAGTAPPCNAPASLAVSSVTSSSATLSWGTATGATNYDLQYRVNGGSWISVSNLTGTSYNASGLNSSTTYNWQVRTSCGATNTAYTSGANFTTSAPPGGCTTTITSFPYSNNFESNLGWTQDTGDDFDWTRQTGGTPSSGTGPSAASQGSWYAYMEVSSPNYPSKVAILNSPCFDMTGVNDPEISFDYHMLTSPGTISLEASTNGTSWTSIWSLTGDQGSAWSTETVSLSAYTSSSTLRLRFNGTSSNTWQGDICIDDIQIAEAASSCPQIDFNSYTINSYGGSQDGGSSSVQDGGATLFIQNNAWKYISLSYTVTANTVIEFDFQSTLQGEIHGIGFDSDNSISSNLTFKVHGTQNWGITNYDNYSGSGWTTYTIPAGSFYTGSFDRLFFVADHDGSPSNGNAYFRNVKVYEGSCGSADNIIAPAGKMTIGNEGELQIGVYPNPFQDEVSVVLPYVANETANIVIYNAIGKRVFSQANIATGGEVTLRPQIAAGVYFVRVQIGDTQTNVKLIKTE